MYLELEALCSHLAMYNENHDNASQHALRKMHRSQISPTAIGICSDAFTDSEMVNTEH